MNRKEWVSWDKRNADTSLANYLAECRRRFMDEARQAKAIGERSSVEYWLSAARWFHADTLAALRGEEVSEW